MRVGVTTAALLLFFVVSLSHETKGKSVYNSVDGFVDKKDVNTDPPQVPSSTAEPAISTSSFYTSETSFTTELPPTTTTPKFDDNVGDEKTRHLLDFGTVNIGNMSVGSPFVNFKANWVSKIWFRAL